MKFLIFSLLLSVQFFRSVQSGQDLTFVDCDGITRTYYISSAHANWFQAKQICSQMNMRLASITSSEIQEFAEEIISAAGHGGEYFWTSGNDLATMDEFYWDNDQPFDYLNWRNPETNATTTPKHCVVLLDESEGYRWMNVPCSDGHFFICEDNSYNLQLRTDRYRIISSPAIGLTILITNFGTTFPAAREFCADFGMTLTDISSTTYMSVYIAHALNSWGITSRSFWSDSIQNRFNYDFPFGCCDSANIAPNGDTTITIDNCYVQYQIICTKSIF